MGGCVFSGAIGPEEKGLPRINQDKSHHVPSLLLSSISSDKVLDVLHAIAIERKNGR
jgi:hypothetical protein